MLADVFTRPLQGSLFRKLRDVIMGHKHINSLKETTTSPSQERVGQKNMTEIVRNGDDGQKTDQRAREPMNTTYADIVRKGRSVLNRISGLKVRGARTPLTFKN